MLKEFIKKVNFIHGSMGAVIYVIISFCYLYEISFNNKYYYPNIDWLERVVTLLSIPSMIGGFPILFLHNDNIIFLFVFLNMLFYYFIFGFYYKKINKVLLYSIVLLLFCLAINQYLFIFSKEGYIKLNFEDKNVLLSGKYQKNHNIKTIQDYAENISSYYNENESLKDKKIINKYNYLNHKDTLFLQENEQGYSQRDNNIQISIIENDIYNNKIISLDESYYRAFYFFSMNSILFYHSITINNTVNLIESNSYLKQYCHAYYFNEKKKNFCLFFKNKLSNIIINDEINYQMNVTNINLFDLRKYSLLGNKKASRIILSYYQKNSLDYVFWLMIGAENGDKTIQKEFGEFLKSDAITDDQLKIVFLTRDEKDIRGEFWIKRSQEN